MMNTVERLIKLRAKVVKWADNTKTMAQKLIIINGRKYTITYGDEIDFSVLCIIHSLKIDVTHDIELRRNGMGFAMAILSMVALTEFDNDSIETITNGQLGTVLEYVDAALNDLNIGI